MKEWPFQGQYLTSDFDIEKSMEGFGGHGFFASIFCGYSLLLPKDIHKVLSALCKIEF